MSIQDKFLDQLQKELNNLKKMMHNLHERILFLEKQCGREENPADLFDSLSGDLPDRDNTVDFSQSNHALEKIIPHLAKKFRDFGFFFTERDGEMRFYKDNSNEYDSIGGILANNEVALLINMLVEPKNDDVTALSKLIISLRERIDNRSNPRKMLALIAASNIHEDVRNFILEQGFFLAELSDNDVIVTKPLNAPKEWQIAP